MATAPAPAAAGPAPPPGAAAVAAKPKRRPRSAGPAKLQRPAGAAPGSPGAPADASMALAIVVHPMALAAAAGSGPPLLPGHRGRGRPKGSRNKPKAALSAEELEELAWLPARKKKATGEKRSLAARTTQALCEAGLALSVRLAGV